MLIFNNHLTIKMKSMKNSTQYLSDEPKSITWYIKKKVYIMDCL